VSIAELKRWPLLALHAHLEKIERQIDEQAQSVGGDTLDLWRNWHCDNDVEYLWGVDRGLRNYFAEVSQLVRQREWSEIATLRAGRAA
jgi:hypothetical protein